MSILKDKLCVCVIGLLINSFAFGQSDTNALGTSHKNEFSVGFPTIPPFFFSFGRGMGGTFSGPTIYFNKMESKHYFFPPVNILI
jgi:hypothetical protein